MAGSAFPQMSTKGTRGHRRWRSRLLVAGIVAVALGVGFYRAGGATASSGVTLLSEEVKRGTIEDVVTATGKILPRAYVDVGAQASGRLDAIPVRIGESVRQGDLLARIDPQVQTAQVEAGRAELHRLEANLAAQEAEAAFAAAQLKRNAVLAPGKAISQAAFDEATRDARIAAAKVDAIRAEIEKMQSTLKSDEAKLGYTSIYAPMSGTVVSIDAREGQTLNAAYSTPVVMRIADLTTMTVWTQVSEADVTRLFEGMEVWFTTLGHGDRRWTARLKQVLPAPHKPEKASGQGEAASSGSTNNVVLYTALFDVDNGAGELRPEMTAQVSFVVDRRNDVVIAPVAALRFKPLESGHSHVDVLGPDGRRIDRGIMTGLRTRFEAQVLSGLEPGERVVTGARQATGGRSLVGFRL
ncbi:efflux RND transporter periplasmic adaptor subunit [Pseudochelatococcus sp. B33]